MFKSLIISLLLILPLSVNATQMQCHGQAKHWRDVAYSTGPMSKYKDLRKCIAWTAYQFNLPEELMYAMLDVERGPINGTCKTNKNGTQDCGPAQINDVRLKELRQFELDIPFNLKLKEALKKEHIKLKGSEIDEMVEELWQLHSNH